MLTHFRIPLSFSCIWRQLPDQDFCTVGITAGWPCNAGAPFCWGSLLYFTYLLRMEHGVVSIPVASSPDICRKYLYFNREMMNGSIRAWASARDSGRNSLLWVWGLHWNRFPRESGLVPHPWKCLRLGWMGFWKPVPVGRVSAHGRGVGTRLSLRSLSTQIIQWFYEQISSQPSLLLFHHLASLSFKILTWIVQMFIDLELRYFVSH